MLRRTALCAFASLALAGIVLYGFGQRSRAAEERRRTRPVAVGELAVNPFDIIAVYRPPNEQITAVYLGRPGQDIQVVFFRDPRNAMAIFSDVWNNNEITKNPGDADPRPLTRMLLAGTHNSAATMVANVDRILAVSREPNHRYVRIFLDKPNAIIPVAEPTDNGPMEKNDLEIPNIRDEADSVMAAYKACICNN